MADELGGVHMPFGSFQTDTDTDTDAIQLSGLPGDPLDDPTGTRDPTAGTGATGGGQRESIAGGPNVTLHQCARNGDVDKAKGIPDQLVKLLNAPDKDKMTPIHYAARYNHYDFLEFLLLQNADVSPRDEEGLTPLHYAARFQGRTRRSGTLQKKRGSATKTTAADPAMAESVITLLVTAGADVNEQDSFGQTPLHYAAMKGNKEAVCQLLAVDTCDNDAVDSQGVTPLHVAALRNQGSVCKLLIEAGVSLHIKDDQESTALHAAAAGGHLNVVRVLLETGARQHGSDMKMVVDRNIDGDNCLSLAVENGHYDVTKLILQKRGDVNKCNKSGNYPLHLAAVNGDARIVRLLTENYAEINVVNNEQATPLHKAAQYNHVQCVDMLVESGSDLEATDGENYTPLLLAVIYGHSATVDFLIANGADVNAVDENDKTVIYLAAEQNKSAALEVLLTNDAVKNLISDGDRFDNGPLHVAAGKGFLPVVRLLIKSGASLDSKNDEEQTPLHMAAKCGRTNIVRELVKQDRNSVTVTDENSNTPLHLAALFGHAKVADVLIELGADVAARNSKLQIPLACAAAKGWTKTANILIEEDSTINAIDRTKTTSLHLASTNGHTDVVQLLIERGADVQQRDADGNNCLDLAIDNNNPETASVIINSDYWHEALRNHTVYAGRYNTPMRKLIRNMPDVAEQAFNRCIKENDHGVENSEYAVTFNYEFLDDLYSVLQWKGTADTDHGTIVGNGAAPPTAGGSEDDGCLPNTCASLKKWAFTGALFGGKKQDEDDSKHKDKPYTTDPDTFLKNHPLMIMVTAQREALLAHPLVNALLRHKWKSFGRTFYYINFLIYSLFLVMITGYIVNTDPPYMVGPHITALSNDSSNDCEKLDALGVTQNTFPAVAKYFIILLSVFNLLKELLQLIFARLKYLNWENLIEWVIYVTALLLVIDVSDCQKDTGYRHTWQWNVGTVAIFLTWMNLVLFMQKFPRFGIYVVMFRHILYTFLQFSLVFVLFIIAFALAFFAMLQDQGSFASWWQALIKTSVMMIGEFDYDSIFTDGSLHLEVLSYLMFIVFIIVMSIIIMNLLVGLAVDNIQEVQQQAGLTRKAMQVELALNVERMLPDCCRRRFVEKQQTIQPNRDFRRFIFKLFGMHTDLPAISNIGTAETTEFEKTQERVERLQAVVDKIRYNQKAIGAQGSIMEGMLKALMKAQDIPWPDEEFQDLEEVRESGNY